MIWTERHRIPSYHADSQRRLTLPYLCGYLQEAAWHHAEALGVGYSHFQQQGIAWVLLRQRLEVRRWPLWGEEIRLETWPSEQEKLLVH
ncbi:MAG: acyl-CoA thioesterase [Deinococcales bacterium]